MKLICQVCARVGHSVTVCYYRFDKSFQIPVIPSAAFLYERDVPESDYEPSAYMAKTCPDFRISDGDVW